MLIVLSRPYSHEVQRQGRKTLHSKSDTNLGSVFVAAERARAGGAINTATASTVLLVGVAVPGFTAATAGASRGVLLLQ